VERNRLVGNSYSFLGEQVIQEGKVSNNEFSFYVIFESEKIFYQGSVNGDSLKLKGNSGGFEFGGTLRRLASFEPIPVPMTPEMTEVWYPVPPIVDPGPYSGLPPAPSDAIVLFDGTDLSAWKGEDGEAKWEVKNGILTAKKGSGPIESKMHFGDFQMHIEWKIPIGITGKGQSRGNSGIIIQGRYEVQILDSYKNPTYVNGQAGSIYKQATPLVNAMRKPGEWNVFDILYVAPRFKDNGALDYPARITVFHNRILIHNDFEIQGKVAFVGLPKYSYHEKGPIKLQDHPEPNDPISFRNIWVRAL
jgi:hypothetical protein